MNRVVRGSERDVGRRPIRSPPAPFSALLLTLLLALCWRAAPLAAAPAAPAQPPFSGHADSPSAACSSLEYRWMQRALDTWAMVSRSALELAGDSLPWIVLFDDTCTWHLAPKRGAPDGAADVTPEAALRFGESPVVVVQLVHGDSIILPSGQVVPAEPTAFTSLYDDGAAFFVMALPSVWRDRDPADAADPALEEFFLGVLAHEMTHTTHLAAVVREITAIGDRWTLPEGLSDDIVQQHFDNIPDFARRVETETETLYRAAAEQDDAVRREMVRQALEMAGERRDRYFTEEREVFRALEDLFLMMEGVAGWAAYRVTVAHAPAGAGPAEAVERLRQGEYWSQDMGLAIFLVLDSLLPGWQARVFAAEPPSVFRLLEEAAHDR